jgi:hypothetical protein
MSDPVQHTEVKQLRRRDCSCLFFRQDLAKDNEDDENTDDVMFQWEMRPVLKESLRENNRARESEGSCGNETKTERRRQTNRAAASSRLQLAKDRQKASVRRRCRALYSVERDEEK